MKAFWTQVCIGGLALCALTWFSYEEFQRNAAAQAAYDTALARQTRLERHVLRVRPTAPAKRIVRAVLDAEAKYGIDAELALSLIQQESTYRADATSTSNARGLMQLVRTTAKIQGLPWEMAYDIEANVDAGVRYLKQHMQTHGGRIDLALARYHGIGHPLANPRFVAQTLAIYRQINPSGVTRVTVKRGDTLSKLAATYLGDMQAYPLLAAYNQLSDPNSIAVGQILLLPQ